MVQTKKPVVSRKVASSASAGRVVPKAAAKRVSVGRKLAAARDVPHVSVITAGGYTVFGSPVQPAHLTTEQIAQAIAELD